MTSISSSISYADQDNLEPQSFDLTLNDSDIEDDDGHLKSFETSDQLCLEVSVALANNAFAKNRLEDYFPAAEC